MSRAKVHEVSSPISLFPFIGILLCTMGALLVILVAVSRSARDTAEREVVTRKKQAAQPVDDEAHKKLDEIKGYVNKLTTVSSQAERKLRDEQMRLSHVEDHIRRLHEKMQSLELAAGELLGLEEEHYDDRKQAEREVERLQQLIVDSRKTLASMREAGSKDSKSYAVVPYEGPNGTFRRPIYIECVKNELVLQPEGVRITADDLRPPFGPGNPLATVLRAARDHILRQIPQAGKSRDTEPYPLLLVRPDGLYVYDRARQAIEAGDFDLGFELVESDWKLKFPQADPQLSGIEMQALEQARARQELLAAAAPRAYASPRASGEFEFDDEPGNGSGGGGLGGGSGGVGGGRAGGSRDYVVRSNRYGGDQGNTGDESEKSSGGTASGAPGATQDGTAQRDGDVPGNNSSPALTGAGGDGATATTGGAHGAAGPGGSFASAGGGPPPAGSAPDKNLVPDGYQTSQSASVVAGSPGPAESNPATAGSRSEKEQMASADSRGKDWALRHKPAKSVPIRRTIRVTVGKDQLAILPDAAPVTAGNAGKVVPMPGDTVESLDEFVKQVRDQIDGWGIAGNGLYWRPVVMLNVGPDGGGRANDLTRLLKNSGLEIRTEETARNLPQGSAHETR